MVFSSAYFLFLFLPFALALCLLARGRLYLCAIFFVSVLFYFWSAGPATLVLLGLIAGNFLGARFVTGQGSRPAFVALVLANLSVLFWFKYSKFVFVNFDAVFGTQAAAWAGEVTLPAGVSFFVFQAISYLTDVRRGDIAAQTSLITYGAYQAFFPHLIAGPIVRFRDVVGDLVEPKLSVETFAAGGTRFAHGLLKKVIIADGVAPIANAVFDLEAHQVDFSLGWTGALAYAVQIYFDFSGYSDMAIGLALMFGVRFHENFARPYASRSVTEFWRRWHISLSSWFRDYVYIPLGGSRHGTIATYRNLLLVFAVTGLWHGAAWCFLLWGLFHGLFLVAERMAFREPAKALRHPVLRYAYCLPVVVFGWVLFRATTLHRTLHIWRAMLSPGWKLSFEVFCARGGITPISAAALALGSCIFLVPGEVSLGSRLVLEPGEAERSLTRLAYMVFALLASGVLMISSSYSPFLYFNF